MNVSFKRVVIGLAVLGVASVMILGIRERTAGTANASDQVPAINPGSGELAALADNEVTFEEYDAGFQAMVSCLAKAGWQPKGEVVLTSRRVYKYQFWVPDAPSVPSATQRSGWENSLHDCRAVHFNLVQALWERQMVMPPDERQQARNHLAACMRSSDLDVSASPSEDDLIPFLRVTESTSIEGSKAFRSCLTATQAHFDLRPGEVP